MASSTPLGASRCSCRRRGGVDPRGSNRPTLAAGPATGRPLRCDGSSTDRSATSGSRSACVLACRAASSRSSSSAMLRRPSAAASCSTAATASRSRSPTRICPRRGRILSHDQRRYAVDPKGQPMVVPMATMCWGQHAKRVLRFDGLGPGSQCQVLVRMTSCWVARVIAT